MRQRGWTLKEILVVLAIIAALAALLYPIGQIVRYRVLEAKCRSNLWAIYTKYKLMKTQNGVGGAVLPQLALKWFHLRAVEARFGAKKS
jgi:prepilin-type N-terminal cleavage/methylation domain-containing protein